MSGTSTETTSNHWLNATEAASYLSLPSRRALYQAVRRGTIPAYRWGKRLRFKRLELDDVLEEGRTLTQDDYRIS